MHSLVPKNSCVLTIWSLPAITFLPGSWLTGPIIKLDKMTTRYHLFRSPCSSSPPLPRLTLYTTLGSQAYDICVEILVLSTTQPHCQIWLSSEPSGTTSPSGTACGPTDTLLFWYIKPLPFLKKPVEQSAPTKLCP